MDYDLKKIDVALRGKTIINFLFSVLQPLGQASKGRLLIVHVPLEPPFRPDMRVISCRLLSKGVFAESTRMSKKLSGIVVLFFGLRATYLVFHIEPCNPVPSHALSSLSTIEIDTLVHFFMEIVPEEAESPFEPALRSSDESSQSRQDQNRHKSPSSTSRIPTTSPAAADKIEAPARRRVADPEVIQKVEIVVLDILESLQRQDDEISITLKSRQPSQNLSSWQSSRSSRTNYKLSYPGATPEEAWRFSTAELVDRVCQRTSSMLTCSPAVVLRILELIHEALVDKVVVSKR